MVTISRVEYEAQQERIAQLDQQVSVPSDALHLARHKQFGASSEKNDESLVEQLSFLFNEAEVFAGSKVENEMVTSVAAHILADKQGKAKTIDFGLGKATVTEKAWTNCCSETFVLEVPLTWIEYSLV